MNYIENNVINIIEEKLGLKYSLDYSESSSLRLCSDLGADSLDMTEIHMLLEDRFDISFPDDYFCKIDDDELTVKFVIDSVTNKVGPHVYYHTNSKHKINSETIPIEIPKEIFTQIAKEAYRKNITINELIYVKLTS